MSAAVETMQMAATHETTLRAAVELIRARAAAVSVTAPSPWIVQELDIVTDDEEPIETLSAGPTAGIHWRDAQAQRAHVASWHPAVAFAVADWLEATATAVQSAGWEDASRRALAVARVYLGEVAG